MFSFLSRRLAALALIGAFALIAAACGSDATTAGTADDVSSGDVSSGNVSSGDVVSGEELSEVEDGGHDTDEHEESADTAGGHDDGALDQPIRGSDVVEGAEPADAEQPDSASDESAVLVMVTVAGGDVTIDANGSDSDRVEVPLGSNVRLMVTSDVVEHIHVHGYDLFVDLAPGDTALLDFVAEIPGLVEVELEDSGTFLFELSSQ